VIEFDKHDLKNLRFRVESHFLICVQANIKISSKIANSVLSKEMLKSLQQQARAMQRNVSSQLHKSSSASLGELMKPLVILRISKYSVEVR